MIRFYTRNHKMRPLLLSCMFIVSTIFQSSYMQAGYTKRKTAYELIEESYITPELQWSILNYIQYLQPVTLNLNNGMLTGIEPIPNMLNKINYELGTQISNAHKERIKNALHAMMEATHIANFVVSVQALYQKDQDTQTLSATFQQLQQQIQGFLNQVNAKVAFDQAPSNNSYFSWLYTPATPQQNYYIQPATFLADDKVSISAPLMEAIVQNNDYKKQASAAAGAGLLFKACFIAQQHHLHDGRYFSGLKLPRPQTIDQYNYIFNAYPDFHQVLGIALGHVTGLARRDDLSESTLTEQHKQAHSLLLHIRQAVETACYIANKKSNYNIGYAILPESITKTINSYLDGIVAELMTYEAQLSDFCLRPQYGATELDHQRAAEWSTVSKVAAGLVVTGAVVGGIYFASPTIVSSVSSYLPSVSSISSYIPSVSGWLPWGSTPAQPAVIQQQGPVYDPINQPPTSTPV